MQTLFNTVYDCFLGKITDDMYMELNEQQTYAMLKTLLINALHYFEFPRVNIYDYNAEIEEFNIELTYEEINIIATFMVVEWLGQQLANVDNVRMLYSGSDFKMTSQANHMAKLKNLKEHYFIMAHHLDRLYKRRKTDDDGIMRSTFGTIMEASFNRGGGRHDN